MVEISPMQYVHQQAQTAWDGISVQHPIEVLQQSASKNGSFGLCSPDSRPVQVPVGGYALLPSEARFALPESPQSRNRACPGLSGASDSRDGKLELTTSILSLSASRSMSKKLLFSWIDSAGRIRLPVLE